MSRRTLVTAALAGAGALALQGAAGAPAQAAARPRHRVLAGAYVPDPYWDPNGWPAAMAAYAARTGARPAIVHWFAQWEGRPAFPTATARTVLAGRQRPLLTWEPWDWSAGPEQPRYRLRTITAGHHDRYVRHFARQAAAVGGPVHLRFAPEMNGDWNPWSERVNGNHRGDYVRAWRHVRALFRAEGARNVRFVWTPIVSHWHSTPMRQVFPGNHDVDVVGLDGYNWGATKPFLGWQSYREVFGPSLREVRALSRKPLWLAEIGCAEQGGDKAAWVRDCFARVAADPRVAALVWFDADKETDWRVNSSPRTLAAFQHALRAPAFR